MCTKVLELCKFFFINHAWNLASDFQDGRPAILCVRSASRSASKNVCDAEDALEGH